MLVGPTSEALARVPELELLLPPSARDGIVSGLGGLVVAKDMAVVSRFAPEELESGITDAHIEFCAENDPPHQAILKIFKAAKTELEQHPFVQGALANPVAITEDQAKAWFGAAGTESDTFYKMLQIGTRRFPRDTTMGDMLGKNIDDERGKEPGGGWKKFNSHRDHFKDVGRHTVGRMQDALIGSYLHKPGVNLAGRLAIQMGKYGNAFELGGYMILNEGITHVTYKAAYEALKKHNVDTPSWFFELHSEVDEQHFMQSVEAVLERLKESDDPRRDLKTTLYAIRQAWTAGMRPLLNEVMVSDAGDSDIQIATGFEDLDEPTLIQ